MFYQPMIDRTSRVEIGRKRRDSAVEHSEADKNRPWLGVWSCLHSFLNSRLDQLTGLLKCDFGNECGNLLEKIA